MRKLSDDLTNELSFIKKEYLENILKSFEDTFTGDRFDIIKHIAKHYTDEQLKGFLYCPLKNNTKSRGKIEEEITEIRSYYTSDTNSVDKIVRKRGRKKSSNGGTLKDKIFKLLDNGVATYEEVLKEDGIFLANNTFKTILSQWRKTKGIIVKRGRKK